MITTLRSQGAAAWITVQLPMRNSRYAQGGGDAIDKNTSQTSFCNLPAYAGTPCWRDWYSSPPLLWDFYRNAVTQLDQLRQRIAFALQQTLVVSSVGVTGLACGHQLPVSQWRHGADRSLS